MNTVLFPSMVLPLHIFEERYKLMINNCLAQDKPFGVVLIYSGSEVGDSAIPHPVGTVARIANWEWLPDGRMNILTAGARRFRIVGVDESVVRQDRRAVVYRTCHPLCLPMRQRLLRPIRYRFPRA